MTSVQLNYICEQLNLYLGIIIFIFGTTGNILNCLVLRQKKLRENPCGYIFFESSIVSLLSISIGMPTRILDSWGIDPTEKIDWICKLHALAVFSSRNIMMWLLAMATFDRWLVSSVDIHRRQMSSLKNVKRVTIIIILASIIAYLHLLYCQAANITDMPEMCFTKSGECSLATNLLYLTISISIPLILMVIFGLLTISNLNQIHGRVHGIETDRRVVTHGGSSSQRSKKIDHSLLRMLILQVLLLVLCYFPQAIQNLYSALTHLGFTMKLDVITGHLLYNLEVLLAFMAAAMPFYVYTLAGGIVFREGTQNIVRSIHRKICF